MEDSPEAIALRRSADIFKKSVDPDAIITRLYSSSLLTPEERAKASSGDPYQRIDAIFVSLERRIAVEPANFNKLVKILKGVSGLRNLGEALEKALRNSDYSLPTAPTESGCERGQMVVPAPHFPSPAVPASSSRYAYPSKGGSSLPQNVTVPTSSFSSLRSGNTPLEDGARLGSAPVQDSQQHQAQHDFHRPRHIMSPSDNFRRFSESIRADALRAGVTPDRSRKLGDLTRKYNSLSQKYDNKKTYYENEVGRLNREKDELETALDTEREECDTELEDTKEEMRSLIQEMERLWFENEEIKQKERATGEKNAALAAELKEKEEEIKTQREQMKRCTCKFCLEMYDTTLELHHTLQTVLDDKAVHDESFRERMKELKAEVEEKKNATWP